MSKTVGRGFAEQREFCAQYLSSRLILARLDWAMSHRLAPVILTSRQFPRAWSRRAWTTPISLIRKPRSAPKRARILSLPAADHYGAVGVDARRVVLGV